jgi:hypothetical protein
MPLEITDDEGAAEGDLVPAGVADCGVVCTLVVRALVLQAAAQGKQPFTYPKPRTSLLHGSRRAGAGASLAALGSLACVSVAYRDEVRDAWQVDALLEGLAAPPWRAWARRYQGQGRVGGCVGSGGGSVSPSAPPLPAARPSLGTLWRLLRAEAELPRIISGGHDGAAFFDASEHVPLLRSAAVGW